MLITIVLHIITFALGGLAVWWHLRRRRQYIVAEALSKSAIASRQVQSFVSRIGKDTENAIVNFAELLQHLNSSIKATTGVVDEIRAKMALTADKDPNDASDHKDLKLIQSRYQAMLNEVMVQLNLTVQRKSEDIDKLDHIREGVIQMRPFSKEISAIAFSTRIIALNAAIEAARAGKHGECFAVVADEVRNLADKATTSAANVEGELTRLTCYIEEAIDDVKSAMDVETRFINSTITLLQDVVLSVVDSFVKLSEVIQKTMGDSSRFRDDVNGIVINLQFEDICNQMSQHTVKLIDSVQEDLEQIHAGKYTGEDAHPAQQEVHHRILAKVGKLFTMAAEVDNAREALNIKKTPSASTASDSDSDDVIFFEESPPAATPKRPPANASGAPKAAEDDDVVFFDDTPAATEGKDDEVTFFDEAPEPAALDHSSEKPKKVEAAPKAPKAAKRDKPVKFEDDEDVTFF